MTPKDEAIENPAVGAAGSGTESSEMQPSKNIVHHTGGFSPGNLRRATFHLGDADRAAIRRIRERLDLPSTALVIRYAVRLLDKRLTENQPPLTPLSTALLLGGIEKEEGGGEA